MIIYYSLCIINSRAYRSRWYSHHMFMMTHARNFKHHWANDSHIIIHVPTSMSAFDIRRFVSWKCSLSGFSAPPPSPSSSSFGSRLRSSGTTAMSRTARNSPALFRCSFSTRKKFHTNLLKTSMVARMVPRMSPCRNRDPASPTEILSVQRVRNIKSSMTARM